MNNYCTNCGKKLEKDELVCKKCNTPIVELPYNYVYKSPSKIKLEDKVLTIISIVLVIIVAIFLVIIVVIFINKNKVNNIQKKYVEPYLNKNYGSDNYSVKYDSSGKCIISGDCYSSGSCNFGGTCIEYEYLDRFQCKSYYYRVNTKYKDFIVTVVKKKNGINVVEGRNIYGTDKSEEKVYHYDDAIDEKSKFNNNDVSDNVE